MKGASEVHLCPVHIRHQVVTPGYAAIIRLPVVVLQLRNTAPVPILPQDVVVLHQLQIFVQVPYSVLSIHEVEGKVTIISQGNLPCFYIYGLDDLALIGHHDHTFCAHCDYQEVFPRIIDNLCNLLQKLKRK